MLAGYCAFASSPLFELNVVHPRPGFGRAAEAMSGAMQITGYPGQKPLSPGFSLGDTVSGLTGAFALMMGLYHRDGLRRNTGQVIDIALFESLYRLIEWQTILFDQLGIVPERNGVKMGFPGSTSLINNYLTKDIVKDFLAEVLDLLSIG